MRAKLKILILEDNPSDVEFVRRELRKAGIDFTSAVADSRDEFVDAIKEFGPEVILSDHSLPQFNSIEALRICKEMVPGIPFILVTGTVSEEFAVEVIKSGADDYILKGHLIRLPSAIENALLKKKAEKEKEKMLQQILSSNNELNTFVYKATHDLRGPLASILGLTKLAEREENHPQAVHFIRMISECTEKLDDILISLIETMVIKNSTPSVSKINFRFLLDSILKKIETTPGYERVIFHSRIGKHADFFCDEKILRSVLQNIIENSVRYQDHAAQKPQVTISISDADAMLRIEVADNGIGMDAKIQENIFDMFYRGNEESKGSGLGLYLVKSGVQRLGGMINLKSESGKGTVFSIYLPGSSGINEAAVLKQRSEN